MQLGIVGSGGIVKEVLEALQPVYDVELAAIWVREHSKEKGQQLAQQYDIPAVYTDYDNFLKYGDMDFVYIGLVNSAHYEYTKRALLAGVNVILEKPFASSYAEVQELSQLAKDKGLFLFEAVSLLHMDNFYKIQELLPELGPIRIVQANYSQYSSRYDKYLAGTVLPAFDPTLSGGALYDINIYNLNLIIGLFGAPESVSYHANKGFNGIDTSGIATLSYPDFQAVAIGAKDSASPSGCMIQGENGWLRIESSPNELKSFSFSMRTGQEKPDTFQLNRYSHRLSQEFEEFARIHAAQDYAARDKYLDISLAVAKVAELCRHSAGIDFGK